MAQAATPTTDGSAPLSATIAQKVTHVPVSTLNKVGLGSVLPQSLFPITRLTGARLNVGGKPDLLTFIDGWCPHCAAASWGLAIALSRFGTLSRLREIDSGTLFGTKFHGVPPYPHTKGLSFLKVVYTSSLLSFTPVILQTVAAQSFQAPTAAQKAAVQVFDPSFLVPVDDVGGAFGMVSSPFFPNLLAGMSWTQIANVLADPTNALAKEIDGEANLLAAAICRTTSQRPANVCSSAGVTAAAKRLPKSVG